MSILAWLILGLIAGFIASKIVNKTGEGVVLDIILGIVGAFVGGFLFTFFGAAPVTGLNIYSLVVAVVGAIVVLFIYHAVAGRRAIWRPAPVVAACAATGARASTIASLTVQADHGLVACSPARSTPCEQRSLRIRNGPLTFAAAPRLIALTAPGLPTIRGVVGKLLAPAGIGWLRGGTC
jgi:uncharacterized membrane protein YeaQ/YmgE (transglycosylase-associated protein family)